MSFFNAKLRYALCAVIDLAMQPPAQACQSRDIAARQDIPGPYLDQILASLKGAGLVRSIRGAGGGYNLARSPERISVGDIVRAVLRSEKLFSSANEEDPADITSPGATWIVRNFVSEIESELSCRLDAVLLSELVQRKTVLDESLSIMPGL